MTRLRTGIEGLDQVLEGGLPDSSICLVSGPPGSGKTVMTQQVVYSAASEDQPAVYFTTVAEPLEKIIAHVQCFSFCRHGYPGRVVHYVPLGRALCDGGLLAALAAIKEEITRAFPAFVIIDSFRALRDFNQDAHDMAHFLYEFAGMISSLKCSTFLLDESPVGEVLQSPAAALVDAIIHLDNVVMGRSERRSLQVLKLRGSGFLPGSHLVTIDPDGIRVYPRIGAVLPKLDYALATGRCPSGIAGLDTAFHGGFPRGSVALITGSSGTGKTVFGLTFALAGVAMGESAVYASLQETPAWLLRTARDLGWDIAGMQETGRLAILYTPPIDIEVDRLAHELLAAVDRVQAKRVVIDAITDLDTAAIPEDDYHSFLYSLGQVLQSKGITSILTANAGGPQEIPYPQPVSLGRLADALIHLDLRLLADGVSREAHVVKVRADCDGVTKLPFRIAAGTGITVTPRER